MTIKILSGAVYEVDVDTTTDAWTIFNRFVSGTATAEDEALIVDTGNTAWEVRAEGE
jgi:hypothetical protein|tara:strand:+ start:191 stop:361 length:171 start_codon:yes stop_codon:yes gene_type:complete